MDKAREDKNHKTGLVNGHGVHRDRDNSVEPHSVMNNSLMCRFDKNVSSVLGLTV